jgi:hypothetical protein
MGQHFTYAVNWQCADPNNHSGPRGPPSNALGIAIYVVLAAVVVGYFAFWIWMYQSRGQHPHSVIGRAIGRIYSGAVTRRRVAGSDSRMRRSVAKQSSGAWCGEC